MSQPTQAPTSPNVMSDIETLGGDGTTNRMLAEAVAIARLGTWVLVVGHTDGSASEMRRRLRRFGDLPIEVVCPGRVQRATEGRVGRILLDHMVHTVRLSEFEWDAILSLQSRSRASIEVKP